MLFKPFVLYLIPVDTAFEEPLTVASHCDFPKKKLHVTVVYCLSQPVRLRFEWAMSSSSDTAKGQDAPGEDLSEGWGSTAKSPAAGQPPYHTHTQVCIHNKPQTCA